MSKVTPVEEPELSVNENPHIHIHLHSVGEIIPKTSNQNFFENMPHRFNYVEPDGKKLCIIFTICYHVFILCLLHYIVYILMCQYFPKCL